MFRRGDRRGINRRGIGSLVSNVIGGGLFTGPGTTELPVGMTFSRASVATARTGVSTVVDLASGQAGVAYNRHGYTGLQHEASATNLLFRSREIDVAPWLNAGGSLTPNVTAAPDGTTTADRSVIAGSLGTYQSKSIPSSSKVSMSGWYKPHTGAGVYQFAMLATPGAGLSMIQSGWTEAADGWAWFGEATVTNATASQIGYWEHTGAAWSTLATGVSDGQLAAAEDLDLWGAQLEVKPYPTSLFHTVGAAGTRAASFVSFASAAACLDAGRLSIHLRVIPHGKHADYTNNFYLWYLDANNYALVTAATRILTVIVGGATVYTAASAIEWWQGRPLDIWLAVGGGVATKFAWQKWDGGWTVLTGGNVAALTFGATALYVLSSNADNTHFDCLISEVTARKATYNPASNTTVLTATKVVIDGNSLTVGTGAGATPGRWAEQLTRSLGEGCTVDYASAVSGQSTTDMVADYAADIGAKYSATARRNILVVWELTNDLLDYLVANNILGALDDVSPAVTYVTNELQTYCALARATGYKLIVLDIIARGQLGAGVGVPDSFEPARLLVNAWVAANWSTFADAYVPVGGHSKIGVVATTADTAWFADYVHCTNLGYDVVERMTAPYVEALAA